MKRYGTKKISTRVAGHQRCGDCHPAQKSHKARARRAGLLLIALGMLGCVNPLPPLRTPISPPVARFRSVPEDGPIPPPAGDRPWPSIMRWKVATGAGHVVRMPSDEELTAADETCVVFLDAGPNVYQKCVRRFIEEVTR